MPLTVPSFLLAFFLSTVVQSATDHSTGSPLKTARASQQATPQSSDAHRPHKTCLLRNMNPTVFRIIMRETSDVPNGRPSIKTGNTCRTLLSETKTAYPPYQLQTMSVTAKAFFVSAVALTATTVWGVHYLQKWEYDVCLKSLPFTILSKCRTRKLINGTTVLEHVPRDLER